MPDKFKGPKKPKRPDMADLDQPLFDYRNQNYLDDFDSPDSVKKRATKKKQHPKNKQQKPGTKGAKTGVKTEPEQVTRSRAKRKHATDNTNSVGNNANSKQPQGEPFNSTKVLKQLPKRGEQIKQPRKQTFAKRVAQPHTELADDHDLFKRDQGKHHTKVNDTANYDHQTDTDHDQEKNRFDPAKDDNSLDPADNKFDTANFDKDKVAKNQGKNNKDQSDFNPDSDQAAAQDSKDAARSELQDDEDNPGIFKRVWNFITGKKNPKKHSFKELLTGEKKKAAKKAPKPAGPIHNLKDIWDRVKTWLKRLTFLLRLYLTVLRLWLLYKIMMLIHALINLIINIFRSIINFFIGLWNVVVGFFGTVGAIVTGVFSLVTVVAFGAAFLSGLWAALEQQSESNALESYNKACHTAYVQSSGTGADDAKLNGKAGDWTKKGTIENKRAHAIFKSWVDRGLDGGAAAGIVGWVTGEGGYFTIIDRAEGHFGNTEKEAGISAGVEPTPPPGAWYKVGGGGIYQFTPYTKFAGLGKKKWLSAKAQNAQVVKELAQAGGWNPSPSIVGVSFMTFAAMSDPTKATLKWDGYEKGNIDDIQRSAAIRETNARQAYKMFHGADYKFNKKKVESWYQNGNANGAGAVTDSGSTADPDKQNNPDCQIKPHDDSDDAPSSDSLVAAATKEAKGDGHPGGAKYDYWFGAAPGTEWCAIFVSWVLHHTKGYEYIPKQSLVSAFASYFKQKNEDHSYKATPKPGWIIFFDWSNEHNPASNNSHIGIVTSVKNGMVNTVEGNDGDGNGSSRVKLIENEYSIGDKRISMYATPHKK